MKVSNPSTLQRPLHRDAGAALCQHAVFDLMSSGTFSSSQMWCHLFKRLLIALISSEDRGERL